MANAELLHKTLEHIKANPKQWNQHTWNDCFAGWAVRLGMPNVTTEQVPSECGPACCPPYKVMVNDAGSRIDVRDQAGTLLGLTEDEKDQLFWGRNSLADVERIVGELTAKEAVSA